MRKFAVRRWGPRCVIAPLTGSIARSVRILFNQVHYCPGGLNLPRFFCLGSSRVLPVTCMSCLEDCNALEILDYRICRLSLCAHW